MTKNNTALKKIVFDSRALEYMRSELSYGHTLAQSILKLVNLEKGTTMAFLPEYVSQKQALEFTQGWVDQKKSDWYLPEYIFSHMSTQQNISLVIEDPWAYPTDPFLANVDLDVFFYKSEVYYFLTSERVTLERIISTIKDALGYPFIGMLTAFSISHSYRKKEVPEKIMENIVEHITHLIVGAYDNQNELIWKRYTSTVEEGD